MFEVRFQPATVPDVALSTPCLVTLNGALANVALPNCIPSSASAMNILSPLPSESNF